MKSILVSRQTKNINDVDAYDPDDTECQTELMYLTLINTQVNKIVTATPLGAGDAFLCHTEYLRQPLTKGSPPPPRNTSQTQNEGLTQ